jgi:2-C-methyl-D-erythritol 2,4-cyclodiphosphate synthase
LIRIGFGYDAHRLVEGRDLILGGVVIPHDLGPAGHSDADVLTHAVIDAVIGAMGEGDIGRHFPDTDAAYSGISSMTLLRDVAARAADAGYRLNNLDATIVAEKPKLAAHLPDMERLTADALSCTKDRVNIKATTTEGMGFCGAGEGMAAYAVVTLIFQDTEAAGK